MSKKTVQTGLVVKRSALRKVLVRVLTSLASDSGLQQRQHRFPTAFDPSPSLRSRTCVHHSCWLWKELKIVELPGQVLFQCARAVYALGMVLMHP